MSILIKKLPIQWQSEDFKKNHDNLVDEINQMAEKRDEFLAQDFSDADLLQGVCQKILFLVLYECMNK